MIGFSKDKKLELNWEMKGNHYIPISVIVPVYNIEKYLERCVQSICNQTYQKLEIILVDDGSTDGSGALCDQLAQKDERIKVFHKENGGSSSARNLGLQNATGEYIGFIDSDDYIEPTMYEKLLSAILKFQVPMAQISRDEIDEDGNRRPDVCVPPAEIWLITNHDMMEQLLMHKGDCSFCTRLTHKSLFENRQFPENKLNEDFYLLSDMLTEVEKFAILPWQEYHVFYRIGSNTRKEDKNDFSRVFMDIVDNADWVLEMVKEKYPDLLTAAYRFLLFQRLDYMLHIPIPQMTEDNTFYKNVCQYLKENRYLIRHNPYLTEKNKLYLLLFSYAPKKTREIHAKLRGIK